MYTIIWQEEKRNTWCDEADEIFYEQSPLEIETYTEKDQFLARWAELKYSKEFLNFTFLIDGDQPTYDVSLQLEEEAKPHFAAAKEAKAAREREAREAAAEAAQQRALELQRKQRAEDLLQYEILKKRLGLA